MSKTDKAGSLKQWARERCEAWNWNCNVAEIARELIDADVRSDGVRFEVLKKEFLEFFQRPEAESHIEIIGQIIDEFGN